MVVVRLARGGDKKNPFYRIVVTDKRNPRDGRFIEQLGYYDPMARGKATPLQFNLERLEHWLKQGAVPSPRVNHLTKLLHTNKAPVAGERRGIAKLTQAKVATDKHKLNAEKLAKEQAAAEAVAAKEAAEKEKVAAKEAAEKEKVAAKEAAEKEKAAAKEAAEKEKSAETEAPKEAAKADAPKAADAEAPKEAAKADTPKAADAEAPKEAAKADAPKAADAEAPKEAAKPETTDASAEDDTSK